jgi:hypothetical protein
VLDQANLIGMTLEATTLQRAARALVDRIVVRLGQLFQDLEALDEIDTTLDVIQLLPFRVDLWKAQNAFFEFIQGVDLLLTTVAPDDVQAWKDRLASIGAKLGVRTPE